MSDRNRDSRSDRSNIKVYLIGGGIASLAAAAFLIRDGHVPGQNITILEELDRLGGSLDGAGSPDTGYVLRGGRWSNCIRPAITLDCSSARSGSCVIPHFTAAREWFSYTWTGMAKASAS